MINGVAEFDQKINVTTKFCTLITDANILKAEYINGRISARFGNCSYIIRKSSTILRLYSQQLVKCKHIRLKPQQIIGKRFVLLD